MIGWMAAEEPDIGQRVAGGDRQRESDHQIRLPIQPQTKFKPYRPYGYAAIPGRKSLLAGLPKYHIQACPYFNEMLRTVLSLTNANRASRSMQKSISGASAALMSVQKVIQRLYICWCPRTLRPQALYPAFNGFFG